MLKTGKEGYYGWTEVENCFRNRFEFVKGHNSILWTSIVKNMKRRINTMENEHVYSAFMTRLEEETQQNKSKTRNTKNMVHKSLPIYVMLIFLSYLFTEKTLFRNICSCWLLNISGIQSLKVLTDTSPKLRFFKKIGTIGVFYTISRLIL